MIVAIVITNVKQFIYAGFTQDGAFAGLRPEAGASVEVRSGKIEVGSKKDMRRATFTVLDVTNVGLDDGSDMRVWKVRIQVDATPSVAANAVAVDVSVGLPFSPL